MKLLSDINTINARLEHFTNTITGHFINGNVLTHLVSHPIVNYNFKTAKLPNFEKFIFKRNINFVYHLSGYGNTNNKSYLSLMGEAVERFSFVTQYKYHTDKIATTYIELQKKMIKNERILDLDFVNIYNYDNVNQLAKNGQTYFIKINSFKKNHKIWIPLQLFAPGVTYELNDSRLSFDTVSTGTASHETIEKSAVASICEIMQLDSFNMWWYYGFEGKVLNYDIESFFISNNYLHNIDDFFIDFSVKLTNISFDKPVFVIVCEIESKIEGLPKYTVGLGSSINLENSINSSINEALAILEYTINIKWIDNELYRSINSETIFSDLDKNVIYYGKVGRPKLQRNSYDLWNNHKVKNERELFSFVEKNYENAGFLNITPPEFMNLNQNIVRVVIPELTTLVLPNKPINNHPKYKSRGIINNVIHPLP